MPKELGKEYEVVVVGFYPESPEFTPFVGHPRFKALRLSDVLEWVRKTPAPKVAMFLVRENYIELPIGINLSRWAAKKESDIRLAVTIADVVEIIRPDLSDYVPGKVQPAEEAPDTTKSRDPDMDLVNQVVAEKPVNTFHRLRKRIF